MMSQELRVSTPRNWPLRLTAGLFTQRQTHQYQWQTLIDDLSPQYSVAGWPDTFWLTQQRRINRDLALFAEGSYDILSNLTFTAGLRQYRYDNTLFGFYGYSLATNESGYSSFGEIQCTSGEGGGYGRSPCNNLNKRVTGSGNTPKFNLSYKIDAQRMVYATVSKGFRPGGINRVGNQPNYGADYLKNYEVGWKTSWAGNRLRFNGALYREDWDNFQFSFIAPNENGIPQITNAAKARVKGAEMSLDWAATRSLTVSVATAFVDAKLAENYCGTLDANGAPVTRCTDPQAPEGQQLPVTPKFKGDVTARYNIPFDAFNTYVQGAFVYQSAVWADLRTYERQLLGQQPAYGLLNLAAGGEWNRFTAELFVNNVFDRLAQTYRYAECAPAVCAPIATYVVPKPPRVIGVRFGQRF
jgi:outer membrane receptor protein involved in Fe transport